MMVKQTPLNEMSYSEVYEYILSRYPADINVELVRMQRADIVGRAERTFDNNHALRWSAWKEVNTRAAVSPFTPDDLTWYSRVLLTEVYEKYIVPHVMKFEEKKRQLTEAYELLVDIGKNWGILEEDLHHIPFPQGIVNIKSDASMIN